MTTTGATTWSEALAVLIERVRARPGMFISTDTSGHAYFLSQLVALASGLTPAPRMLAHVTTGPLVQITVPELGLDAPDAEGLGRFLVTSGGDYSSPPDVLRTMFMQPSFATAAALSTHFQVESSTSTMAFAATVDWPDISVETAQSTGSRQTTFSLFLDPAVFQPLDASALRSRLYELACLSSDAEFTLDGTRLAGDLAGLLPGGHLGGPYHLLSGQPRPAHLLDMAIRCVPSQHRTHSVTCFVNKERLGAGGAVATGILNALGSHPGAVPTVVIAHLQAPRDVALVSGYGTTSLRHPDAQSLEREVEALVAAQLTSVPWLQL